MIAYPDPSFLCAPYRPQMNSASAALHAAQMKEALYLASPLLSEFRQSLRWQAYLHTKDSTKGFDRISAQKALAKLQANIAAGVVEVVPMDWADVTSIAERLSAQYTWTEGYREFDVLHVATALHLGVSAFLTFDARQQQLAEAEGLVVPLRRNDI